MINTAIGYIYDESSLKEKQKKEWYIDAIDKIIKYITELSINDKTEVQQNLNAADGIIDISFIKESLKAYVSEEERAQFDEGHNLYSISEAGIKPNAGTIPSYLPSVDFISQIKERFLGEYIRQYSELQVYSRDPKVVAERNRQLDKTIRVMIETSIMELIEGKKSEEEIEEIDFEKHEKEFLDKWIDEKTINYQHKLNIINDLTHADTLYIQGFLYWFATEQVVTYRDLYGINKLRKEVINPVEYYRLPNSMSPFIKDDAAGVRMYSINIHDIITYFQEDLTKKDIEYIKELIRDHKIGNGYSVPAHRLKDMRDMSSLPSEDVVTFSKSQDINIYHIVMQSVYPIQILTYVSSIDGSIQQEEVSMDYTLDESIGDLKLEPIKTFVPIEMYRIGEKDAGVYIKPRELSVELEGLPYNGITGYLGLGKCNPIPKRIAGLSALYKFYTLQQQRAVAKYKNWLVIPESILEDSEEMSREDRLAYAKKDDVLFYNDEEASANTLQGMRAIIATNAERYIELLIKVKEDTRKEAMDVAGMNEQRYGDTNPNAGKAVTEYAITRATTASIALFNTYNTVKEQDALLDLIFSKPMWENGFKGTYYNKATNKVEYVDIPPEDGDLGQMGVYVKNGILESDKKKSLTDLAFSMGQNGQPLIAVEAIDSDSSTQIKRIIKDTMAEQEKLEESMRKYEEQVKLQVEQTINEREQTKMQHEGSITLLEEEMNNLRTALQVDADILIEVIKSEKDNTNKQQLQQKQLEVEKRKEELKQKEMEFKAYLDSLTPDETEEQAQ